MTDYHIMDTSALLAVAQFTDPESFQELLECLTRLTEQNILCLPKAVVAELSVLGREEPITFWALGIGRGQKSSATVDDKLAVMHLIQLGMGYEVGVEDVDGSDPTIVEIAALCHQYEDINVPFLVVSEDRGSVPLRPTLEEICARSGWAMLGVREGLKSLGLDEYLIQ